MARARHKQVHPPRPSRWAPRIRRLVLPATVATMVTGGVIATGVSVPDEAPLQSLSAASADASEEREPIVVPEPVSVREAPISRSEDRVQLEAIPEPVGKRFATAKLNVWTRPTEKSKLLDVLDWADKVWITGETQGKGENAFAEIVVDDRGYWVHAAYLAKNKPEPEPEPEPTQAAETEEPAPTGLSTAPCASGSDVESGLTSNAVAVHRAVCAAYPEVTSYGGVRPGDDGDHGSGQALDIMISGATGDAIAEYVRANAGELGVSEVLWSQQIWSVERSSEGWRPMEDRGSTTANHYDHVHVSVY